MNKISADMMFPYEAPVNLTLIPNLTLLLFGIGIFFTVWFFVYEVTSNKYTRELFKEFFIALAAAVFSGFGILFLLLWVGIYV